MKTIIYNSIDNTIIKMFDVGYEYEVDGIIKPLGEIEPDIWHLEQIDTTPQEILPTQYLTSDYSIDYLNNTYTQIWNIHNKTQLDMDLENWDYHDFNCRIKAPIQLIMDDIGIKMYGWFNINNLPIINKNDGFVYLYCNEILPEHQTIIDQLVGTLTIENKPN